MRTFIPVYSKTFTSGVKKNEHTFGIFLVPDLQLTDLQLSSISFSRILINASLGSGIYYHFKHKNTLTTLFNVHLNEDEFTVNNPQLNYSGLLLYSHQINPGFSYFLGTAYSFLYGDIGKNGFLFPVIGSRIRITSNSSLLINFPFTLNYISKLTQRTFFSVYVKPNGGINRVVNRMNIQGADEIVLLRRRSFISSCSFNFKATNNFIFSADAGYIFGQKYLFTNADNLNLYEIIYPVNTFQFGIHLIWKPWQNKLRNKLNNTETDNMFDFPDDLNILGF